MRWRQKEMHVQAKDFHDGPIPRFRPIQWGA